MNTKNTRRGFTIVEVMIVLAVAGLIFAIVFLAVPQVQRGSRDTKRRAIVARLVSELDAYAQEHEGTYPFKGRVSDCRPPPEDGPSADLIGGPWANQCAKCNPEDPDPPDEDPPAVGPGSCREWYLNYIDNKIDTNDPETDEPLIIKMAATTNDTPWPNKPEKRRVYVSVGNKCKQNAEGEDQLAEGDGGAENATSYALVIPLDQEERFYCLDSHQLHG